MLVEGYDYQFYKGVMYFYCKDYASAKKNFNRSLDLLEKKFSGSQELTPNDEEFLNEFNNLSYSNHSFNCHELYYNIVLCSILSKDYEEAATTLKFFDSLSDGREKAEIKRLSAILMMETEGK